MTIKPLASTPHQRLTALEACRGFAAIVVLVHHFFLGFSPLTTGRLESHRNEDSLAGTVWFFFVNGNAAVLFFFTLSGFVLTWSYFNSPDPYKLKKALFKRWPRLAGIVVLITLSSWVLFKLQAYAHIEAALVSDSPWLAGFAGAGHSADFQPSFWAALTQGLTTFVTGKAKYNCNLWTMKPEFLGSMLIFLTAPLYLKAVRNWRSLAWLAFWSVLACLFSRLMLPFLVGAALSLYVSKNRPQITTKWGSFLLLVGIYCLGYFLPVKHYAWLSFVPSQLSSLLEFSMHLLGALLVIYVIMAMPKLQASMNGEISRLLGKISFPLYLAHALVICSVSSWVYLWCHQHAIAHQTTLIWTFLSTVAASLACCYPLMTFDDWWVSRVDAYATRWVKPRSV